MIFSVLKQEFAKLDVTNKKKLRRFYYLFAAIFLLLGFFIESVASIIFYGLFLFFIFASIFPLYFRFLYRIWMTLAIVIGTVMSRIFLVTIFYLLFTPLSLIIRLTGKDLLDRKIADSEKSYWKQKEVNRDHKKDKEKYLKIYNFFL